MSLEGFIEYKRREFCNDVKCPVQMELNRQTEKSEKYEQIRRTCSTACRYTTWQFHHWLIEKGYIIIASLKLKNKESIFASIDNDLLKWIDEQVQSGKYHNRSHLIESIIAQYRNRNK
jgi:RNA:NAD 2'-phosphotransferase (TPT1/KptA family)